MLNNIIDMGFFQGGMAHCLRDQDVLENMPTDLMIRHGNIYISYSYILRKNSFTHYG